jgi:hypothetical protein
VGEFPQRAGTGLSKKERCEIGGVEYRAIRLLCWIVPVYMVMWQLLGCFMVSLYIGPRKGEVSKADGVNPWCVLASYSWMNTDDEKVAGDFCHGFCLQ